MRNLAPLIAFIWCSSTAASGADEISDVVHKQLCSAVSATCVMKSVSKKQASDYELLTYRMEKGGHGLIAALVEMVDGRQNLLKIFSGIGANGGVVQANFRQINNQWYLEIYEETGHGDGQIELYELNAGTVSSVFHARAVDWNDDGSYFDGGILQARYVDSGGGHFSIILEGTVLVTDDKTDRIDGREECRRIYNWDELKNRFEESSDGEIIPKGCADSVN